MNVVKIISVNKKTKQRFIERKDEKGKPVLQRAGHKAIAGCAECIIDDGGHLVTRHCVKV